MTTFFEIKKPVQGMKRVLLQYVEALDVLFGRPDSEKEDSYLATLDGEAAVLFEGRDDDIPMD